MYRLQEHNIEPIEWFPNSPDLNPIENIWKLLKEELWKAHGNEYPSSGSGRHED
jgi:transposase